MGVAPKFHMVEERYINGELRRAPVCKVHNLTYCYAKVYKWEEVTCKRCLKRRDQYKGKVK